MVPDISTTSGELRTSAPGATQARLFGDLNDPESAVTRVFEADEWDLLKPELQTESMAMYLGLPRVVV